MIADKATGSLRLCVILSVFMALTGLMFTAGCGGDSTDSWYDASQQTTVKIQKPEDLDTLLKSNNCVSCDLSNWHFNQLDLSHSDLSNANLANTTFVRSNLSNANLRGANLSGANLEFAILNYANLTNANLEKANLTGAKLYYANLTSAKLDGAMLDNANLTGVTWNDGSE